MMPLSAWTAASTLVGTPAALSVRLEAKAAFDSVGAAPSEVSSVTIKVPARIEVPPVQVFPLLRVTVNPLSAPSSMMKPTFGVPIVIGLAIVPALISVMPVKVPLPSRRRPPRSVASCARAQVGLLMPPALRASSFNEALGEDKARQLVDVDLP